MAKDTTDVQTPNVVTPKQNTAYFEEKLAEMREMPDADYKAFYMKKLENMDVGLAEQGQGGLSEKEMSRAQERDKAVLHMMFVEKPIPFAALSEEMQNDMKGKKGEIGRQVMEYEYEKALDNFNKMHDEMTNPATQPKLTKSLFKTTQNKAEEKLAEYTKKQTEIEKWKSVEATDLSGTTLDQTIELLKSSVIPESLKQTSSVATSNVPETPIIDAMSLENLRPNTDNNNDKGINVSPEVSASFEAHRDRPLPTPELKTAAATKSPQELLVDEILRIDQELKTPKQAVQDDNMGEGVLSKKEKEFIGKQVEKYTKEGIRPDEQENIRIELLEQAMKWNKESLVKSYFNQALPIDGSHPRIPEDDSRSQSSKAAPSNPSVVLGTEPIPSAQAAPAPEPLGSSASSKLKPPPSLETPDFSTIKKVSEILPPSPDLKMEGRPKTQEQLRTEAEAKAKAEKETEERKASVSRLETIMFNPGKEADVPSPTLTPTPTPTPTPSAASPKLTPPPSLSTDWSKMSTVREKKLPGTLNQPKKPEAEVEADKARKAKAFDLFNDVNKAAVVAPVVEPVRAAPEPIPPRPEPKPESVAVEVSVEQERVAIMAEARKRVAPEPPVRSEPVKDAAPAPTAKRVPPAPPAVPNPDVVYSGKSIDTILSRFTPEQQEEKKKFVETQYAKKFELLMNQPEQFAQNFADVQRLSKEIDMSQKSAVVWNKIPDNVKGGLGDLEAPKVVDMFVSILDRVPGNPESTKALFDFMQKDRAIFLDIVKSSEGKSIDEMEKSMMQEISDPLRGTVPYVVRKSNIQAAEQQASETVQATPSPQRVEKPLAQAQPQQPQQPQQPKPVQQAPKAAEPVKLSGANATMDKVFEAAKTPGVKIVYYDVGDNKKTNYVGSKEFQSILANNASGQKKVLYAFGENDMDFDASRNAPTSKRSGSSNQAAMFNGNTYEENSKGAVGIVSTMYGRGADTPEALKAKLQESLQNAAERAQKEGAVLLVPAKFDDKGQMTEIDIGTGVAMKRDAMQKYPGGPAGFQADVQKGMDQIAKGQKVDLGVTQAQQQQQSQEKAKEEGPERKTLLGSTRFREAFVQNRYVKDIKGDMRDTYDVRTPNATGDKRLRLNPLAVLGNAFNAGCNFVGAGLKFGSEMLGNGLKKLGSLLGKPLEKMRDVISDPEAGVGKKILAGIGMAVVGAPLKAVGMATSLTGTVVKSVGEVAGNVCGLTGAIGRAAISLGTTDGNAMNIWKQFTKTVASVAHIGTDLAKDAGGELKELGNQAGIPVVSQVLRVAGATVQGVGQAVEGVVQGARKMAVNEWGEGAKLMLDGIASGGKGVGKEVYHALGKEIFNSEYRSLGGRDTTYTKEDRAKGADFTVFPRGGGVETSFEDAMKSARAGGNKGADVAVSYEANRLEYQQRHLRDRYKKVDNDKVQEAAKKLETAKVVDAKEKAEPVKQKIVNQAELKAAVQGLASAQAPEGGEAKKPTAVEQLEQRAQKAPSGPQRGG